ncbi:MAG: tetratricopeptide repeat protein [Holophagales bacterium]|nr:MAG: tetratricopeptide repeat protein [Holophagales bacterium]
MRRVVLILAVLLVVAAAALLVLRGPRREWTTDSPEALAAYQRGLEDLMRYYREDAHREFEQALALDPTFVAAKVQLIDTSSSSSERKRLMGELGSADRSHLTGRERFLVEYLLAYPDDAARARILERYLGDHPRDSWAVFLAAGNAWGRQDWASAEELYRRLLTNDPNWVMAHNHLGYIAMAQGRFAEAEDRFRTYAFVAPDQANPHDSLGELLILRGRYDEARRELEAALAVRPDFCASYGNLDRLAMLQNDPAATEALLPRVQQHCNADLATAMRCQRDRWVALAAGKFDAYWTSVDSSCLAKQDSADILAFRLALFGGQRARAEAQLAKLRSDLAATPDRARAKALVLSVRLAELEAIRAAYDGDDAAAIAKLAEADALAPYWNDSSGGLLKLADRLLQARLRERAGDRAAAAALRAEVAAVNPSLAPLEASALIAIPPRT